MGHNINMLEERNAEKGMDENHTARFEIEECVHFHTDDFRFVFTTQEALKIAQMFTEGKKILEDLGSPEYLEHMVQLGGVFLDGKCMHNDRLAAEVTRDGSIHVHLKNLRIHMTPMDFYEFADGMRNALMSLGQHLETEIDITADNVIIPSIAYNYLDMLKEYYSPGYQGPEVPAEKVSELRYKMKWHKRHPQGDGTKEEDLQRKSGYLPKPFPGVIPDSLNEDYLYSMCESIKKWGYASGPFYGDYMPVYKYPNGKIYLKGAHRTAALLHLGITNIKVLMTDAPTGWATE